MGDQEQKTLAQRTGRIRELNDRLRQRHEGRVVITRGIASLPVATVARVLFAVRDFAAFDARNDPHGEGDMGRVEVDGHECWFRIDYFSADLESGSPDPADENITTRVMTILLAEEL
ncbi:hypothetical protein ASE00_16280 [Sphingomonas sp. Root710]|uniref:DUF3768 domain-containing protein n=1 Tax=Sphingomonas sp. Root710 TaxID=1736594 RepID=UPI0006FA4DEE|nr:DUF3768 domain-containing protein [Sphingomonas sp. Root710]KRB80604.1 hypothetical protein ASE00_16280 [Sphingomonas sp. Root710]